MKKKVVQFNERHKWCGCFGFVNEEKPNRLMIGVPMPQQGTAYIFCTEEDVDYIGETDLLPIGEED
ncbi:MAG: hypothetical protein ACI4U9_03300 [Clostridia bacterium]